MPLYAVYLHLELLDVVPKRGAQHQRILRFIRSLADNPFATGDFSNKDDASRQREIKIIGDHAITYQVDHPGKMVMILDISPADQ